MFEPIPTPLDAPKRVDGIRGFKFAAKADRRMVDATIRDAVFLRVANSSIPAPVAPSAPDRGPSNYDSTMILGALSAESFLNVRRRNFATPAVLNQIRAPSSMPPIPRTALFSLRAIFEAS